MYKRLENEVMKRAASDVYAAQEETMAGYDTRDAIAKKTSYVSVGEQMHLETSRSARSSQLQLDRTMAKKNVIERMLADESGSFTPDEQERLQSMLERANMQIVDSKAALSDINRYKRCGIRI